MPKRVNVFEQIKSVKQILQPIAPNGDSLTVRGLVLRCVKYRNGQVKKLDAEAAKAYDLLLKNNLLPKGVYEWLLLENIPSHIKQKLVEHKITQREAHEQYTQWKRMMNTRSGKEIMDEMRNVVRRLKWKSQEEYSPAQY